MVATLEGNWMKEIRYKLKGEKVRVLGRGFGSAADASQEWKVLLSLDELALIPKDVRPVDEQDARESRRLWDPVTVNLLAKNWGEATKQKQVIEQRQRDIAAKLKEDGKE